MTSFAFRFLLPLALTGHAGAFTYSTTYVTGGSFNIFAAGRDSTSGLGGGNLPTGIPLLPASGRSLQVGGVTGATQNTVSSPAWGPDGFSFAVNINPVPGLSGLYAGRAMALLGVFLDSAVPQGASPPTLDFTSETGITRNFLTLAPTTGQIFLIGDGYASSTTQHLFLIPDNATRLFIGYGDAGGFQGNPSNFFDNSGFVSGNFTFTIPVPEPSGLTLAATGALLALRRQRPVG